MERTNKRFSKEALAPLVTGKRVLFISLAWLAGTTFLTAAITDLFTENIFQKQYLMQLILMFMNTIMVLRMWQVYRHKKKTA